MDIKFLGVVCAVVQCLVIVEGQEGIVMITTNVGNILGQRLTRVFNNQVYSVDSFTGIPYAESTHGEGRFMRPRKKSPFHTTFNATKPSVPCPQNIKMDGTAEGLYVSEDCLSLTVVTPAGASKEETKKAVMVFIYGGAFQFGHQNIYYSTSLPGLNDVIYVTMNYRVGMYGFLANRERGLMGNNGLWDQHMALQWVHDNIESFGGDVNRVTIFGESAGAASVIYQSMYEGNRGLFQRAIAESGSVGDSWTHSKYPEAMSVLMAQRVGCAATQNWVACLQQIDVDTLKEVIGAFDMFSPIKDGEFVIYNPEDLFVDDKIQTGPFADLNLMMGLNSNEGGITIPLLSATINSSMQDLIAGINENQFNTLMKNLLSYNNISTTAAMLASIKHAYTNWDMPDDPEARRDEFMELLLDAFTVNIVSRLRSHVHANGLGTAYMYYFDVKPSWSKAPAWLKGANHGDEIPYVLGFPPAFFGEGDPATILPQIDITIARGAMGYWTQFAKTGYAIIKKIFMEMVT